MTDTRTGRHTDLSRTIHRPASAGLRDTTGALAESETLDLLAQVDRAREAMRILALRGAFARPNDAAEAMVVAEALAALTTHLRSKARTITDQIALVDPAAR